MCVTVAAFCRSAINTDRAAGRAQLLRIAQLILILDDRRLSSCFRLSVSLGSSDISLLPVTRHFDNLAELEIQMYFLAQFRGERSAISHGTVRRRATADTFAQTHRMCVAE